MGKVSDIVWEAARLLPGVDLDDLLVIEDDTLIAVFRIIQQDTVESVQGRGEVMLPLFVEFLGGLRIPAVKHHFPVELKWAPIGCQI